MTTHPSHDVYPCCEDELGRAQPFCDVADYCHRCGVSTEQPADLKAPCAEAEP